jgi:aspartyl/glutamyl-tRNA(Asn/Gln) amidotransferase C subunit
MSASKSREETLSTREENPAERMSKTIFDHLVELAAFALEEDESEYLHRELNNQLRAIRELEAIEVDDSLPIVSHGVPYTSAMSLPLREDKIEACPDSDEILEQAPVRDGRFIIVPDIPQEELE